jgi:hypothetical protein
LESRLTSSGNLHVLSLITNCLEVQGKLQNAARIESSRGFPDTA